MNYTALLSAIACWASFFPEAQAQTPSPLDAAIGNARPLSPLVHEREATLLVPGKGRGTPSENVQGLGIALIFAQNNYWTSNLWSAAGYNVTPGMLRDSEGRLASVRAWEISPPVLATDFSFFASGSDLFLQLPAGTAHTVYSIYQPQDIGSIPAGKRLFRFGDSVVAEEARILAADVAVTGLTKIPGMKLHSLTKSRVFFHLPSSLVPSAETAVGPGISAVRLYEAPVGRGTRFSIDVTAWGTPVDSYRNQTGPGSSYGRGNKFLCFPNPDGGLSVCWQDTVTKGMLATTISSTLTHQTVRLPAGMATLGSVTRDDQGNWYLFTVAPTTNPEMALVKADAQGQELARRTIPASTANELNVYDFDGGASGARLAYAGGKLCLTVARGMQTGHQGSAIYTYDSTTLDLIRSYGQNSSHSFASRVIHDGTQFLNMSLGDNYPRGIVVHKVKENSMSGKVVFTYKTKHASEPRGDLAAGLWSNDNRTYTELGGITALTEGYGVTFTSERSTDNALAVEAINEARNVGYVLLAPDFETFPQTQNAVPPGMVLTPGIDSPEFGFYDFGGGYQRQQYRGVVWLTNYTDKAQENASRARIVRLSGGLQCVLWEKWSPTAHASTHSMIIDAMGTVIQPATNLGPTRLSDGDTSAAQGDRIHGVTSDGQRLEWTVLEPFWKKIEIKRLEPAGVAGRWRIVIRAIPGRHYQLQQSHDLGSWSEVPGKSLTASGEEESFTFDQIPAALSRFYRITETQP
jgi:hypothetical protein